MKMVERPLDRARGPDGMVTVNRTTWDVLVVDEDELMRELIEIQLPEGYQGTFVSTARQAVARLTEEHFDLLMFDFAMPEMDGLDLLTWCRERGLHFPVIITMDQRATCARERTALEDCCTKAMPKPFSRAALAHALDEARRRRHERDCRVAKAPGG